jgi:integrase
MYKPSLHLHTTLPQAIKRDEYIPTPEELKKVLDVAKGTKYEIPFRLGTYGMRRSEICALTLDDIEGNTIKINKALVLDKDNNWVLKSTKTTNSTREIIVSDYLINLIKESGTIFKGYPDKLLENLHSMQKKAGVPKCRFHDLRHFFVTELSQAGFSEDDIMYLGRHSSPYVMKAVYRHARIDKDLEERKRAGEQIAKILS